ncbi:MAG: pimelyl-ACP methyl ester esterase BioV [Sulfurimonas sp.]|nr:pimelyl-ACP methyl ester esterase BioV [Sulfurimonas sp.]MDQ7061977.1 pimelyl-ACP methyl ester esterase BioV [Sulfurimonas sp.]
MKFYSGFSLKNEKHFFDAFLDDSVYCVAGFSYGAIKAFEYVKEQIENGKRVDRLQLLSPAFFQGRGEKFKRLQKISYSKNKDKYLSQFLKGCFSPYKGQDIELCETNLEELQELLYFEWILGALHSLESKGVVIEVYLGGQDYIIDPKAAKEFFTQTATVTYIKNANHFLQSNERKI